MAAVLASQPPWNDLRPAGAGVSTHGRLGLTLFFAAVLHAILILGVNFEALKNTLQSHVSTLEITLVTMPSAQKPERADTLANVQQLVLSAAATSAHQTAASAEAHPKMGPAPQARPSAQELVAQTMRIASLSAENNNARAAYAQRPRQKFISATTHEHKYAAYMEAWRSKVERIGNLNYPEQAKRDNLSGSLVLDVALNADGSVNNVALLRSSGHKALDEAAIDIVELAAPYAPFPDNIRKDTDILHITRTWQFLLDNSMSTQ